MAQNRMPEVCYNGSGYLDITARNAICKADNDRLRERRRIVIEKIYEVAKSEGFKINSYIDLVEIESDDNE